MKIVRLEDGSVGFVDRSNITKIFGAFFLFIGALPVPVLRQRHRVWRACTPLLFFLGLALRWWVF